MLLGQDLGWRHQGRLESRLDREKHGGNCDYRLSRADVALQEAVHRDGRTEITAQFLDHARLRIR